MDELTTPRARAVYENTNGFPLSHGKTLHMEVGRGDIANRIITVGSIQRAEKIAKFMTDCRSITSHRGFTTITGLYKGISVSVVSIGMGTPMMDFFVRESRAVLDGPVIMIRFGTCGGLSKSPPGTIAVASGGSTYIHRNPEFFHPNGANTGQEKPYVFHTICPSNERLSHLVTEHLDRKLGAIRICGGVNVTADSFYSSQGRVDDDNFSDHNSSLVSEILASYPEAVSMEMETFTLLHLACCSKKPIYATAAAIIVANRKSSHVIDGPTLELLEVQGGEAILDAIIDMEL